MTKALTQEQVQRTPDRRRRPVGPHYKWMALTNTTLGSLMATIDASIVLIAFLGYNPIGELLPPALLQAISPAHKAILLGKTFFPNLISLPFMDGLHAVFYISAALCLIAAGASLLRGKRVVYGQERH